jgi:formate-dependent nitrite reductase membrane component NrfD
MTLWVFVILFINAVVAFAISASTSEAQSIVWGLLVTNFLFFLGVSQAGIIFSVIMRVSKSKWGRHYSRVGELMTLAFMPIGIITFIIIYLGGSEHLFYWITPEIITSRGGHIPEHISPWLSKPLFFWKNILTMGVFYILSIIYFRFARHEEHGCENCFGIKVKTILNFLGGFICVFFAFANTFLIWDLVMMAIPHWESTIFPIYFWCGNLFAGFCFIYFATRFFIPNPPGKALPVKFAEGMGVLLMGFVLLWIYMFFSQHIVFWYADLPVRTGPLFAARQGFFRSTYWLMMFCTFFIPFIALIFNKVKHCGTALYVVAVIISIGIFLDRYLMVIPIYTDGANPVFWTYTGIALVLGGISAIILSIQIFLKLFPKVTLKAH